MKQKVFVGSSSEAINIAHAIQKNLRHQAEITVWDQGLFKPSQFSLQSLASALENFDFGVFVFSPDDLVTIRGEGYQAVRDNVIFELGLFIGKLGQERSFILIPEGSGDLHLPTDLLGVTPAIYEQDRSDHNWAAATGPACSDIKEQMQRLGRRVIWDEQRAEGTAPSAELQEISPQGTDVNSTDASETNKESSYSWITLWAKNQNTEALDSVEKEISIEQDPSKVFNLRLWHALIRIDLSIEEGEEEFRTLAREDPDKPEAWANLAYSLLRKGFREKALALIEERLASMPDNFVLLKAKTDCLDALQRRDEAERILEERIESAPFESDAIIAHLARLQVTHGRTAKALDSINGGLEHFSFSIELLEIKASILSSSDDHIGAISVYKQLISLRPNESSYHALMGNSLLALDFYSLALDSYRRADSLAEGSSGWIVANIGNAFNNKGFFGLAIEHLEKALADDPSSDYAQDRILSARRNQLAEMQGLEIAMNLAISKASKPED